MQAKRCIIDGNGLTLRCLLHRSIIKGGAALPALPFSTE